MGNQTMEVSDRFCRVTRANILHVGHGILIAVVLDILILMIIHQRHKHYLTNVSFPVTVGVNLIGIGNKDAVVVNIRNTFDLYQGC